MDQAREGKQSLARKPLHSPYLCRGASAAPVWFYLNCCDMETQAEHRDSAYERLVNFQGPLHPEYGDMESF